ncbi:unnamed protein product [Auanema sp. JU1783]|nr:unnamed protein product [Auanema sp. JU1783]
MHFFLLNIILFFTIAARSLGFNDDNFWENPVEIEDIRNDMITASWNIPSEFSNQTTWQRLMINVVRSSLPSSRASVSIKVNENLRTYTFTDLMGNTTYRVSVEAFDDAGSIWYASNMATTSLASLNWMPAPSEITLIGKTSTSLSIWWVAPDSHDVSRNVVINQHLLNVYEFNTASKTVSKKFSFNIPIPKTSFLVNKLNPGTVYNLTIQAGTSYGYGNTVWSTFSTLGSDHEEIVLKLAQRTPNSLTLTWPTKWLPTPTSRFTIKAKTIHTPGNVEKEVMVAGVGEPGRPNEFALRNLYPGSTYNVTITTNIPESSKKENKWVGGPKRKASWSVFSTLTQGEYAVGDPRIVVETDTAISVVFQPLRQLGDVHYQIRYSSPESSQPIETLALRENELLCPKFGCEWLCALIFNFQGRQRDFTFEVRARVDGVWNKWVSIVRRPWNLLERVCSINPPNSFVANIGKPDYQREIDVSSAKAPAIADTWRYLVVVDSRQSDYSSIDIAKLADKATADIDNIPYYVAGSISPDDVENNIPFRLGDGLVHGGYLNYPLRDREVDPRWTLVPLSQAENEIMEPRLKTCGFAEDGSFDCQMSFFDLAKHIPLWATTLLSILSIVLVFTFCISLIVFGRRMCEKKNEMKEASIMYYHNDSPNTSSTTREYRRVERREFKPSDFEERRKFMNDE